MADATEKAQEQLFSAYEKVFGSPEGAQVLGDIVMFAQMEPDASIRCGRLDVIARILRQRQRSLQAQSGRAITARHSTQE